ncbi:DNA mismatch repair protein MutS [Neorickettsia findlayensis]|uniref:DNA mismatch repair protein MutS n=1 Tax=Neorickettsia findlayensis TaxID=2686014 RepID=A0A6P1GA91_9RICK|nr:DNA mismatch repair protein MutS [Neorickettsia findlayensis]QHD65104.1 DNA mismatch repair protein MutS [Neorickettsia findlayensis]
MSEEFPPAMKRYLEVRCQYPDAVIFYRVGDFYEMFFEDAREVSALLGLHLTRRGTYKGKDIPMCGVPVSSCEVYINKLVKLGRKVAICEQLETAEEAKKRGTTAIVRRDVVRLVTPGTLTEDNLLVSGENNYLFCVAPGKKEIGIAWLDISTKKIIFTNASLNSLESYLVKIEPKEVLLPDTVDAELRKFIEQQNIHITRRPNNLFQFEYAENELKGFYNVLQLGFMDARSPCEIVACGALIAYARATQMGELKQLEFPKRYERGHYLELDASTIRGLELVESQTPGEKNSLLQVIDQTCTAGGKRLLKSYVISPLVSVEEIQIRQDRVEFFFVQEELRKKVRAALSNIPDAERALSRIALNRGEPIDCLAVLSCMKASLLLAEHFSTFLRNDYIRSIYDKCAPDDELMETLRTAFLPTSNRKVDGSFLDPAHHPKLLELNMLSTNADVVINDLLLTYRRNTGINSVKLGKNNLIGYYIEVPKSAPILDSAIFIHRQSLSNNIRYTTLELQNLEAQITKANENYRKLELELFRELCERILISEGPLKEMIAAIEELDVIVSFAEIAVQRKYVRPHVDDSNELRISGGRHPFVEQVNTFVPNDLAFTTEERVCVLTGPNMAGKSTYLRQNALITVLAQMGSFVPADSAHIGVVDRVFSRIGASDNIARGKSTFMVEMMETANIVNNATCRSLVILDEVGRGTSTLDGISIAQAVLEYLHDSVNCKTIFATHYNELCDLESKLSRMKCYSVEVKRWRDEILLMYKVVPGRGDKSYGIHTAMLSGIPESIIRRATEIAKEKNSSVEGSLSNERVRVKHQ